MAGDGSPNDAVSDDKTRLPFMPLLVADFLASPKVQAMTTEEIGAYVLLLMACWSSGKCRVPADDKSLGAITRMGRDWKTVRRSVLECFKEQDGFLSNEKLTKVWDDSVASIKKKSDAAKAAADRRWKKCGGNADAYANAMQPHSDGNAAGMLYTNTQIHKGIPSESQPPTPFGESGGGEESVERQIDRLFDHSSNAPEAFELVPLFARTWDRLTGTSKCNGRLSSDLQRLLVGHWTDPGWREIAKKAFLKLSQGPLPLPEGKTVHAKVRRFLEREDYADDIGKGDYDRFAGTASADRTAAEGNSDAVAEYLRRKQVLVGSEPAGEFSQPEG